LTGPVLVVERLSKSFHHQPVLREVDLDVRPGEVHALLGANGSGKSTLIKVVAGIHTADSGIVIVDGQRVTREGPTELARRGVRFVHQDGGLVAPLTVAENLLLGHECPTTPWGTVDRRAERALVAELLGRMHVRLDPDQPVATLRAVERTAVSIGRALAHAEDLRLLVLDEPTAALPATEVATLFGLVERVVGAGAAVLYVTHRLDEVLAHADRATVLRDGRRVATEEVRDLDASTLARLIVGPERGDAREPTPGQEPPPGAEPTRASGPPPAAGGRAPAPPRTALAVTGMRSAQLVDVSLSVAPGEVLGVAGLNGSGRDEVASVLCGLAGGFRALRLGDGPVLTAIAPHEAVRRGLALVPGNRRPGSAVREFTLRENLGITSLRRHRRRGLLDVRRERRLVERWIAELDIRPPDPDKLFAELSGGNQQKVILAKWLAVEPSVVVLDEPTAGVDVAARQSIYDIVRSVSSGRGVAFVVCSADDQDHVGMADRVVLVADGRVAGELRPPEITEHEIATRLALASSRAGVLA
jgi:ribose transport system ATP-binding protein